jgi:hypothetical protein
MLRIVHCGHCRHPPQPRGQWVTRFGVPEGNSEVSYLLQFHLLNAISSVWLNL